jgi:hypothetical protein
MKRIIISLFAFFIVVCSFAQNNSSNITISTTGTSNLKIKFGGKQYSLQDRSVTFQGMQPGSYSLVIYQMKKRSPGGSGGYGGNGYNDYTEVYNSNVTLTARKHLEISVLRFGKVAWDESFIEPDNWGNTPYSPIGNQDAGTGNLNTAVSAEQFALLKKSVSDAAFDSDKLITGRVILKNNWFTAAQIKELVKLFSFDDKKLEFAKLAYDYCVDKGLYIGILDAFSFQSTKNSLLEYIKNR